MEPGQNDMNDAKVVLIGHAGVGKSTLFLRFKDGEFVNNADSKVNKEALAEYQKTMGNGNTMTLFDTAGMEKHLTTLPPTYFRETKAIMYVFAMDDHDTFSLLSQWAENAEPSAPRDCTRAVVGNKTDLNSTSVSESDVYQWATNNDIPRDLVFFVSAKTDSGVTEMFEKMAEEMAPPPVHKPASKNDSCCAKK